MNAFARHDQTGPVSPEAKSEALGALSLLEELSDELEDTLDVYVPNAHLRMAMHLIKGHFEAKTITPTSLIGASRVPYATATRRMKEMVEAGLI